jgi:3-oxoacyl-[acyl-carrier-protein] synthase II
MASTPLGDTDETNAIKAAFVAHARDKLVVRQVHDRPFAGRGGIESVFVLALHRKPPTINITSQDPEVRPGFLRQHRRVMPPSTLPAVKK